MARISRYDCMHMGVCLMVGARAAIFLPPIVSRKTPFLIVAFVDVVGFTVKPRSVI